MLDDKLRTMSNALKKHADPTRIARRRQREQRRMAYLAATGQLKPKPSKRELRAAAKFHPPNLDAINQDVVNEPLPDCELNDRLDDLW